VDNLHLTFAVLGVVLLNSAIGFFQEYRAEKATEALEKLVPQNAKIIRDRELQVIPAADLVPGDVIVLEEGDSISADARLVRQFEMSTNNIALTGESDPVRKTADPILEEQLEKINMPNLVFMGTSVATGNGRAVVFATGMQTEFGRIFELTSAVREEKSPLQRQIGGMARTVSKIAIALGLLLFFMGRFQGLNWLGGVLFALGVMAALVPQGLPATLSVALAIGVQRMAREKALIKKLSAGDGGLLARHRRDRPDASRAGGDDRSSQAGGQRRRRACPFSRNQDHHDYGGLWADGRSHRQKNRDRRGSRGSRHNRRRAGRHVRRRSGVLRSWEPFSRSARSSVSCTFCSRMAGIGAIRAGQTRQARTTFSTERLLQ
jgi:hypothetical protein